MKSVSTIAACVAALLFFQSTFAQIIDDTQGGNEDPWANYPDSFRCNTASDNDRENQPSCPVNPDDTSLYQCVGIPGIMTTMIYPSSSPNGVCALKGAEAQSPEDPPSPKTCGGFAGPRLGCPEDSNTECRPDPRDQDQPSHPDASGICVLKAAEGPSDGVNGPQ